MKKCHICGGCNVYELEFCTHDALPRKIVPSNPGIQALTAKDLPVYLGVMYCSDCDCETTVSERIK